MKIFINLFNVIRGHQSRTVTDASYPLKALTKLPVRPHDTMSLGEKPDYDLHLTQIM